MKSKLMSLLSTESTIVSELDESVTTLVDGDLAVVTGGYVSNPEGGCAGGDPFSFYASSADGSGGGAGCAASDGGIGDGVGDGAGSL